MQSEVVTKLAAYTWQHMLTKPDAAELRKQTQYMEDHLAKNEWFCGDTFTAADIEMSFPVKMYCAQPPVPCPKLQAFTKRCEANPAYKQGVEKGGLRYDMKL